MIDHQRSRSLAGKDATQVFFGLHRHEVLLKPQYKRLQIGTIQGETEQIKSLSPGELSNVPYAEPTWLTRGFYSPYYSDNHRRFHISVREFFESVIKPESQRCEESGKRISQEVVDKMAYVMLSSFLCVQFSYRTLSEANVVAMRLGPGKHLQDRTLLGGIVKPDDFDYFHEACLIYMVTHSFLIRCRPLSTWNLHESAAGL